MGAPDVSLPFFGVQATPRGERVAITTLTTPLALGLSTFLTGTSDDATNTIHVAAAVAVLLFRYSGEPTMTIGMMDPRFASAEASSGVIIPATVSLYVHDSGSTVVSKIADAARAPSSSSAAKADGATPVVVTSRHHANSTSLRGTDAPAALEHVELLAKTDAVFEIEKGSTSVALRLTYDGGRFDEACMERFNAQVAVTLSSLSSDPTQPIKSLQILPEAERLRLLLEFCPGDAASRPEKTVIDLLEEQAVKTPGRRAYICDDEVFTYEQVNGKANSLARELHERGVVKG